MVRNFFRCKGIILFFVLIYAWVLPMLFAPECVTAADLTTAGLPRIKAQKPEDKTFTVIKHYQYRERVYSPPVKVIFLDRDPKTYSGPEAVLVSQLSAMRNLDFDWYLSTWDNVSKNKILEQEKVKGKSRSLMLKQWKDDFNTKEVILLRWIETGEYVVVTYKILSAGGKEREIPTVFRLSDGHWTATLELENDPVLLYFGDKKTRIEKVVR